MWAPDAAKKHVLTSNSQMGKLGLKDGGTYPKRLHPYRVGWGHTQAAWRARPNPPSPRLCRPVGRVPGLVLSL